MLAEEKEQKLSLVSARKFDNIFLRQKARLTQDLVSPYTLWSSHMYL